MTGRFSRGVANIRLAKNTLHGPHYGALNAPSRIITFDIEDEVEVEKTGQRAMVKAKTSWGDYELEGVQGFYPGTRLRLVRKKDE